MDKNYETKVLILRRLLKLNMAKRMRDGSRIMELLERLSELMDSHGDHEESARLYTQYINSYPDFRDEAVKLNNQALQWRDAGHPKKAERLLRKALEIEKRALSPTSGIHPHRMNNLAGVLIMLGKLEEADGMLRRAWDLKEGKHDTTSVRILINWMLLCMLKKRSCGVCVSNLKWLLYNNSPSVEGNITKTTSAAVVVDYLENALSKDESSFLYALIRAANDYGKTRELEAFQLWNHYPAEMPCHNGLRETVD